MTLPLPKPSSDVEAEIFEFVKESDPSTAYLQGASEYAGKLFVPSSKNLERVAKRADELRLKAENDLQLKVIDSLAAGHALQEPQSYPDRVLSSFFGYLIKEGIVPSHLKPLTRNAVRALQAAAQETSEKRWPTGLRLLTLIRCDGLLEIIKTIKKAITAKRSVKQTEILPFLGELRKRTERVVKKDVVGINPKYETKVIETPLYLSAIFPSAGAFFYDSFTNNPKEIFMITTDPKRDPSTVPGELLNGLVHEEYGHCVHASNTATAYGAKPTLTEVLFTPLASALSEGISFHREIEFQDIMDKLKTGKKLNNDEKALVQFFEKRGGLDLWAEEYEFFTWMWRIIRFLRVIGDARINSGKQSLRDFIEWAHKRTGLAKSTVYHQLFPAHQGNGPGYASTYAIIGESIREIQNRAKRNGKNLLDFNTYACSMGFPARTIFEQRLQEFASK